MNRKILYLLIGVCLIFAGFAKEAKPIQIGKASSVPINISNGVTSTEQLKSVLSKYTKKQIAFFESFSIGKNQDSAFAIAGGEVWFITMSRAQKLKDNITFSADNQYQRPFLLSIDQTEIFKCEDAPGGSSSISYAWYVKHGKPILLSYTGMNLFYIGKGQFTTMGEGFDLNFTDGLGTGHTYKHYYLYWANDRMKEYGGLQITKQQLFKIKGAQGIVDTIVKSGHTVDEIYYRANNIININYHSGDKQNGDFDNVTILLKNNTAIPQLAYASPSSSKTKPLTGSNLSDFSYGGIYKAAFFPQIAIYPDKFPGK